MKKISVAVIIIILAGIGVIIYQNSRQKAETNTPNPEQNTESPATNEMAAPEAAPAPVTPPPAPTSSAPPSAALAVKIFNITGRSFAFSTNEIRVKKGDPVKINFESTGGFHDWSLDGYNVKTQQVNPGTPASVEFTADKAGTFEFFCSVGSHRSMGMTGKFIVE